MDVPELTNFGSLMRHALDIEAAAVAFYRGVPESADLAAVVPLLRDLASQHDARRRLVERTRQRTLNEVILEPIAGLEGSRYVFDSTPPPPRLLGAQARAIEEVGERFYRESASAARELLAEAARAFDKLAAENAGNAARIRQSFRL